MNDKKNELRDIVLPYANKHTRDIHRDRKFDCENNCPYCNNEKICIQPQYVLPDYEDDIQWADIYIKFKCLICGGEFWELWTTCADNYHWSDDDGNYFDEYGDYTDLYYNDRYNAYCESFEEALKTGGLWLVDASYQHTIIKLPFYEKDAAADLPHKYQYPIYRRLTPEIVDMFDQGPILSRFDILDIRDDVL
ncbi:MAG: hypothetical protein ACYTE0_07585 [Planctomycetota bacterium]|jgi:hypothetical protein